MKLMHLADLHIGKRVNEFSMIDDQKYILNQILHIAENENVDGIIIAGDVYDKSVPAAEAVTLLDSFISSISAMNAFLLLQTYWKIQIFIFHRFLTEI